MTAKYLKHKFVSGVADGADTTLVRPSNWNDDHDFWCGYRAVTTTTDTIAHADHFSVITYNNAAAIAASIAAPSAPNFPLGWQVRLRNIGAGTVTLSGTGGATINTAASVQIKTGDTLDLHSTGAANYVGIPMPASVTPTFGINLVIFTANGTYTPVANLVAAIVEAIAGGGGGGAATGGANYYNAGAGGGAGAYSRRLLTPVQIGASQAVTIGAGGAGGIFANAAGNGGDTSFGSLVVAKGGIGAVALQGGTYPGGGAGGAGSSGVGDITASGAPGQGSLYEGGAFGLGFAHGIGGNSAFGGGAAAAAYVANTSTVGVAARQYGGGGSGGNTSNASTVNGGAGYAGVCVVTEFHL